MMGVYSWRKEDLDRLEEDLLVAAGITGRLTPEEKAEIKPNPLIVESLALLVEGTRDRSVVPDTNTAESVSPLQREGGDTI